MAAEIRRLRTKPDAVREDARGQLLLALEGLEPQRRGRVAELVRELRRELRFEEASAAEPWTFVMLSPHQFAAVNRWLAQHAKSPLVATQLWGILFTRLDQRTGEVLATRAELAELVNTTPQEVSRIMGQLAEVGAISRRREPANGPVRYFMNPRVGTHLPKSEREAAQSQAPQLRLADV